MSSVTETIKAKEEIFEALQAQGYDYDDARFEALQQIRLLFPDVQVSTQAPNGTPFMADFSRDTSRNGVE